MPMCTSVSVSLYVCVFVNLLISSVRQIGLPDLADEYIVSQWAGFLGSQVVNMKVI